MNSRMILPQAQRRRDGRYELRFPFNRNLVEALKDYVPASHREFEPESKTWIVDAVYAATAIEALKFFFPDAKVSDHQQTVSPPPTAHQSGPHMVLYVLPDAPRCVVDAAYRALVKEFHPDRVPAEQRDQVHEQMIAINSAYAAVRDRVAQ